MIDTEEIYSRLGRKEFKVYLYLKYGNDRTPTIKRISETEGISVGTVSHAVYKLKRMKYLKIRRTGRARYYWSWPDKK